MLAPHISGNTFSGGKGFLGSKEKFAAVRGILKRDIAPTFDILSPLFSGGNRTCGLARVGRRRIPKLVECMGGGVVCVFMQLVLDALHS